MHFLVSFRWMTYHDYTFSSSHSVRVYRDIFDRMSDGEFSWEVYDMSLPDIQNLDDRCLSDDWMSECPLVNYCIVEIHYPCRVLRQFGRRQGIPPLVNDRHGTLHHISFHGRDGSNWRHFHKYLIQYWNEKISLEDTIPIHGNDRFIGQYLKW
ncbi:hypothetical protein ACS0TY_005620 [Phlomoides rotata]